MNPEIYEINMQKAVDKERRLRFELERLIILRRRNEMKQVLAAQLADWIDNNTQGFTKRDGNIINIEGKIDAYELLVYAQSLQPARSTDQIHADNKASYTGRSVNAAVEGGDFMGG